MRAPKHSICWLFCSFGWSCCSVDLFRPIAPSDNDKISQRSLCCGVLPDAWILLSCLFWLHFRLSASSYGDYAHRCPAH
ncbi:hypothetical protein DTO027B5_6478 [Paecilomyces variotii]|nr:hypothetical protein DTO169C6_7063 [Paecilomyces variotii]KAJ9285679.1 hypothetical protein DTO021C3_6786 [Paecilomyces variotii]KAJ9322091.1 hypothetical protein DTO027B3_6943 [Paecilomyces variotii]KAJ9331802.1 hypothetical protein DTO027B5_6478 [Paecilomyces variotii]